MSKRKDKKRQKRLKKKRTQRTIKHRQQPRSATSFPNPIDTAWPDMADPLPDNLPTPAALASAMMEMKDLGDEPEFADLESTLGDDLISVVVEMMAKVEDDLQRLEDKGDEAGIDRLIAGAKSSTLNKLVTPTLVAEVQKRLTRLTRRLRQEGQSQRADLFNGLTQLMDTSFFPWPLFGPLSDALEKTVERIATYTILRTQVAEAVGMSPQDVPFEQIHELLQDPTVLERLQEQFETDQDMRKMLEKQFDQLYTKLTHTLSQGDLHLDLFTMEELALWDALSDQRSTESDIDLEYDEQHSKSTEILAETLK